MKSPYQHVVGAGCASSLLILSRLFCLLCFELLIPDHGGNVISATAAVGDKLFKKFYIQAAAELALLSDMLAHAVHLLSAMEMALE